MGIIWSRFKKKVSTKEILQKLQEEINNLEEYKEHAEQRRKKLVGSLIASSIFFFFLAAVICYFYYLPPTLEERLLYATSFAGFYILVYFIKSVVTCYYRWKVTRNENKLLSLKTKKEEILDQVMETETYKVATEILEIFAPEQIRRATMALKTPATSVVTGRIPLSQSGDVRRRIISPPSSQNFGTRPSPTNLRPSGPSASYGYGRSSMTPRPQQLVVRPNISTPSHSSLQGPRSMYPSVSPMSSLAYGRSESGSLHASNSNMGDPPGPPMPRPILPRERGMLDRFVEYLVGDGPSNRYALVCRQCESHNGMALKEEFPYIAFRCAYCFYWNPARKQKPAPPRLDSLPQRVTAEMSRRVMEKAAAEESSSSEEETETDSSSTSNPSSDDGEDEEVNSFTNRSFVHEKGDKECKEEGKLQSLSSAEEDKIIADHPPSEPESKMPESTPLPTECCSSSVVTDDDPSLPSAETAETSHEAL